MIFSSSKEASTIQKLEKIDKETVTQFLNNQNKDVFNFVSPNPKVALVNFTSFFKVIKAAGGLVKNLKGELLVIKRNGKIDLPKGKVEPKENIAKAAQREVEEECGITLTKPQKLIDQTFHVYPLKSGSWAFKPTYWYSFNYEGNGLLSPQSEEGITDVFWVSFSELSNCLEKTYPSLAPFFSRKTAY